MRRKIAQLLIILMILNPLLTYAKSYDDDSGNDILSFENQEWAAYLSSNGLPSDTPKTSLQGKVFNKELWSELGLVVYGDYSTVGKRNDFKVTQDGYYSKPTLGGEIQKGEYRYHGYDKGDGLITNMVFPNDSNSQEAVTDKVWVRQPWKEDSIAYPLFYKTYGSRSFSDWNKMALHMNNKIIERQINEGLDWTIYYATEDGKSTSVMDKAPVNYMNVTSMSTSKALGEGVMYRYDAANDKIWYQTMPVNRVKVKDHTPVTARIESIDTLRVTTEGDVTLQVVLSGILEDEAYFIGTKEEQDELQQTYYNRKDIRTNQPWQMKLNNTVNNTSVTAQGSPVASNKGQAVFEVTFSNEEYKNNLNQYGTFEVNFSGSSEVFFETGDSAIGYTNDQMTAFGARAEESKEMSPMLDFDIEAPHEILDVWQFDLKVTERSVANLKDKYVLINGTKLSQTDEDAFLKGNYTFQDLDEDRIYTYRVVYVANDGSEFFYESYVVVYDAVPRATVRVLQDSGKVNRKIEASTDKSLTPQFVREHSTVSVVEFSANSREGNPVYFGTNTLELKSFLMKQIGTIDLKVRVSNEYGSRTYQHEIYVGEDYPPVIDSIIWNNVLARDENLDVFSEGTSIDGDTVQGMRYAIFYDEDKDDIPEKEVQTGDFHGGIDFMPEKLGAYKIVFEVQEVFGEETIDAYVTPDDRQKMQVTREFFVENLVPMTKVYTDIEYNFPHVDVAMVVDENFNTDNLAYLKTNAVNTRNNFRVNNMIANVDIWDTHTYIFSQTAYKRIHSGSRYPSATTEYSSDGYTGTLTRIDVDNYDYQVDEGHYVTQTESKTATATRSQSGSVYFPKSYDNDRTPSSVSYNSGGYSGTLSKTGQSGYSATAIKDKDGNDIGYRYRFTSNYSGTVTKSVQVWQSHYVWHDDYYGDYEGTVYKPVKQFYTPDYEIGSNKYIVYFSSSGISNKIDFNYVKNIAKEAKIILVGDESVRGQLNEDYYIAYNTEVQQNIDEIVNIIENENQTVNVMSLLVDEPFQMTFTDVDAENDPLVLDTTMQYIQDVDYFDNPMGLEDLAVESRQEHGYTDILKNKFQNVGKYSVLRRISDLPVEAPNQGKFSNVSELTLYVHRKPIAAFAMDWIFNPQSGKYNVTWTDQSYDLDLQFSDPIDKGIMDRKMKYRRNGGDWIYDIPEQLLSGSYESEYVVQDTFGVWSDPFVFNFILEDVPPVRLLEAKLKATLESKFSLDAIPASEDLTFYDVLTRYPYDEYVDYGIYTASGALVTPRLVDYFSSNDNAQDNGDIAWSTFQYNIPATLADGTYQARVYAVASEMPSNVDYKAFPIRVLTPIDLIAHLIGTLSVEKPKAITAQTTKYVSNLNVTLFYGTGYARTISLTGTRQGDIKSWTNAFTENRFLPEGMYQARYVATTPNGNSQTQIVNYEYVWNKPPTVEFINHDPSTVIYVGDTLYNTVMPKDENDPTLVMDYYMAKPNGTYERVGKSQTVTSNQAITLEGVAITEPGDYTFKVIVTDAYGEKAEDEITLTIKPRGINELTIVGTWTHWRGQIDLYGNRLVDMPHRFLSFEHVTIRVKTDAIADKVTLRFSPELESMTYTDKFGNVYRYEDYFNQKVYFPMQMTLIAEDPVADYSLWEAEYILPLAESTLDFEDVRKGAPYQMTAEATFGTYTDDDTIEDIDITGNTYDMVEYQPKFGR